MEFSFCAGGPPSPTSPSCQAETSHLSWDLFKQQTKAASGESMTKKRSALKMQGRRQNGACKRSCASATWQHHVILQAQHNLDCGDGTDFSPGNHFSALFGNLRESLPSPSSDVSELESPSGIFALEESPSKIHHCINRDILRSPGVNGVTSAEDDDDQDTNDETAVNLDQMEITPTPTLHHTSSYELMPPPAASTTCSTKRRRTLSVDSRCKPQLQDISNVIWGCSLRRKRCPSSTGSSNESSPATSFHEQDHHQRRSSLDPPPQPSLFGQQPRLSDISNVILGCSLRRKRCPSSNGSSDESSPADSVAGVGPSQLPQQQQRGNSLDPLPQPCLFGQQSRLSRPKLRRWTDSTSASPIGMDESPRSWGIPTSGQPNKYRERSRSYAEESPSFHNHSAASPFKSTPVKATSSRCKKTYRSPFQPSQTNCASPFQQTKTNSASPFLSPLIRRHTVTDVASPFLDKALLNCASAHGHLIGDMSRPYLLPILPAISNDDRKYISNTTLRDLIGGKYPCVKHFHIIDCRFPYEYDGGHIFGAKNLYRHKEAVKYLLGGAKDLLDVDGNAPVLIFHCEFSLHRGPDMYRYIRSVDRERAMERYPQLCYPEMYILHGGYKEYHSQFKDDCDPPSYVAMNDPLFTKQLDEYSGNSQFKFRKGCGSAKLPRRLTLRF